LVVDSRQLPEQEQLAVRAEEQRRERQPDRGLRGQAVEAGAELVELYSLRDAGERAGHFGDVAAGVDAEDEDVLLRRELRFEDVAGRGEQDGPAAETEVAGRGAVDACEQAKEQGRVLAHDADELAGTHVEREAVEGKVAGTGQTLRPLEAGIRAGFEREH